MKRYIIIGITLCWCTLTFAQDRKPWPLRVLNSVKTYIDSSAVRGIDPNYIQIPKKPWALVLKYKTNDMDLHSTSTMSREMMAENGINGELNWESSFNPRNESSIGGWIGYRGYGLGYSFSLHRTNGHNFSIGFTGANYGVNLRIRSFNTRDLDTKIWGYDDEDGPFEIPFEETETWDDIKVKTVIFDGFYMFNGKRFSYAAGYDQSSVQKRSAGSFMLGLMWFQTSIDYARPLNGLLIQLLGGVGRIKLHEGSIGVGYSYNWVPVKNLLFNITAMPMLVVYNRTKAYLYDSNYDLFLEDGEVSPTGKYPVPDDLKWQDDITLYEVSSITKHSKLSFNFDARASITYNFNRYFLNVYGQLNHWKNKIDNNRIKLTDWYINASLGFRF